MGIRRRTFSRSTDCSLVKDVETVRRIGAVSCRSLGESARGMVTPAPPWSSFRHCFRAHSLTEFSRAGPESATRCRHSHRHSPDPYRGNPAHFPPWKGLTDRTARRGKCRARRLHIIQNHDQAGLYPRQTPRSSPEDARDVSRTLARDHGELRRAMRPAQNPYKSRM